MVPLSSVKITRVPTYLIRLLVRFVYGAITLYGHTSQSVPLQTKSSANPLSLAATHRISVDFFSSGYLDVSVPRVRLLHPMDSGADTQLMLGGFPHSEISGSQASCRLPEASGIRIYSRIYSGIYSGYSAPGSRIAGIEIQVFQNENSSQTNAYSHYSNYS